MKVFISSTYKDLIDYRAAAIRAVEGTNYQASKMEVFGARPDEPLDACLKEVEESELFIGIYALRYGFIPEGADISITEMEYVHAKKLGRPIYCFLLDEENQPWLKKWIEDEPGETKLKDFKKRLQKGHVCDTFTTADDLRAKVSNALSHFVANHREPESQSTINHSPIPSHCSTLPNQEYFFGRDKELKIISDAIAPESRTWGALIDGPGGIGKTALAIKAAHDAPIDLFERKIFITAKVRELTTEGEKPLTDFTRPTYLAMLDELGKELGETSLEKLPPDERPNTLRLALAGKNALIIFDNLETLPEEERTRLFQFLSRLPAGNKAIVTSRRRTDVDARIVRLDRLSRDEAQQLIAELAAKTPRLDRASQKEREELYEITQGNPLFIRWIAGQLGRAGSQCRTIADACAFIDKAPKGNDPLEYIFGDLLETFTTDETKVLAALEDLTDRSILTSDLSAQTYFLPPLTAKFIRTRRPEAVTQTGDALTNRAYALALQYGGPTNYEGFRTLDAEWDFISAALPRLLTGDNARLQTVCRQLDFFLDFTGKWDDWLWLSTEAEERALATNDKRNAGWRAYRAGVTYIRRGQPAEVLACAARAAEHWQNSTLRNKAVAINLRGHGHNLKKDYPAAIVAYHEALEMERAVAPESYAVAITLDALAQIEHENKDYPAAERDYREALRIAKINKNEALAANRLGNLASLALDREQWAEAESLAREALALAEKVGRQELIAYDCHRLAIALLKQSEGRSRLKRDGNDEEEKSRQKRDLQEALSISRRAVEIYTHLRLLDDVQRAQETLAEIERAMQKAE